MTAPALVPSVLLDLIGCFDCAAGDGGGLPADVEVGRCLEVGPVALDEGWWGGEGCEADLGGL